MSTPFRLYQRDAPTTPDEALLGRRQLIETIGNHRASAPYYQASERLEIAVNTALAIGAPLLLTGEPGTGKTQVAFHLAHFFKLDLHEDLFTLFVRSTTTATDLLYDFDAVAYFRARPEENKTREDFVNRGPLWSAYERPGPTIVLIDEIDKAPRDFPNDLLNVLDQNRFYVPESRQWVKRRDGEAPPLVVITSNSERRLPEPFLRRCVFHHIEFTTELVRSAVRARGQEFPSLSEDFVTAAIARFMELRDSGIRKKPATAELLVWLTVLNAQGDVSADDLRTKPLGKLPGLPTLVKDREDLALIS